MLKCSSDHRPLRIVTNFDTKIHRYKLIKNRINRVEKHILMANKDNFQLHLQNSFDLLKIEEISDVQTQYDAIKNSIKTATQKNQSQ